MNIYIFITILTAFLSLALGTYGFIMVPFKSFSRSFSIYSSFIFILSASNLIMTLTENYYTALYVGYIWDAAAYASPIALLIFVNDYCNDLLKIKRFVKILLYIVPFLLISYIYFSNVLDVEYSSFGYKVIIPNTIFLIVHVGYFLIMFSGIIALLGIYLHRSIKRREPLTITILLLTGLAFFLIAISFTQSMQAMNFLGDIPIFSVTFFILYIFTSTSLLGVTTSIQSKTFKDIFENVEDGILITDSKGNIIDMNISLQRILFGRKISGPKSNKKILDKLKQKTVDINNFEKFEKGLTKKISTNLEICLTGSKKHYYKVTISPIGNIRKSIIGRIAILKDVTESRLLQEKLKTKSEKDFLTNIYNQRFLYDKLRQEIKRFDRYKEPFCLLMLDIDNFKKYNDEFGHLVGDKVLIKVAKLLSREIRKDLDVAARYGGDEFLIILINTKINKARKAADRIINAFNKLGLKEVSLSIGICQYKSGMNIEDLIKNSDDAMYKAKKISGNSIKVFK